MNQVIAVIQARTNSNRLPAKIFKHLKDRSVIEHVVNAVKNTDDISTTILATTRSRSDDALVKKMEGLGVRCFRGQENNVMARFFAAIRYLKGDIIVRLTGDNPLLNPSILKRIIRLIQLDENIDYISNNLIRSFPRGFDVEVFRKKSFIKSYEIAKTKEEKEHVTLNFKLNPQIFNLKNVLAKPEEYMPDLRLTLDTQEDYDFLKIIYDKFYKAGKFIKPETIISWVNANPSILNINSNVQSIEVFGKKY